MKSSPKRFKKLKGSEIKKLNEMILKRIDKLIERYNLLVEEYYKLKKRVKEMEKLTTLSKETGLTPMIVTTTNSEEHEKSTEQTTEVKNIAISLQSLDRAVWYVFKLITSYREYLFAVQHDINPEEYRQKLLKTLDQIDKRIGPRHTDKLRQLLNEIDLKNANGETKAHVNDTVKLIAMDILIKELGINST